MEKITGKKYWLGIMMWIFIFKSDRELLARNDYGRWRLVSTENITHNSSGQITVKKRRKILQHFPARACAWTVAECRAPRALLIITHWIIEALFTPRVFPSPRGLGMRGDLVKTPLSPNPQFSPNFPSFPHTLPTASSYFVFGDERGYERIVIR
jgi:hypothetical protein